MFLPITSLARIAEQALPPRPEGLHDPALVDDDHGVRHGVEDRAAGAPRATSASCVLAVAWKRDFAATDFPDPCHAGADGAKGYGVHEVAPRERVVAPIRIKPPSRKLAAVAASAGTSPPMPAAANTAGTKKRKGDSVRQDSGQSQPYACRKRNCACRNAVAQPTAPPV